MAIGSARDIKRIASGYKAEIFGEAAYLTAQLVARAEAQREKWDVLARLETQMKECLSSALIQEGKTIPSSVFPCFAGQVAGVFVGLAPWRMMLRILRIVVADTLQRYVTWANEASPEFTELLGEFAAHERAQLVFMEAELEGKSDSSLDEVRSMLRGTEV